MSLSALTAAGPGSVEPSRPDLDDTHAQPGASQAPGIPQRLFPESVTAFGDDSHVTAPACASLRPGARPEDPLSLPAVGFTVTRAARAPGPGASPIPAASTLDEQPVELVLADQPSDATDSGDLEQPEGSFRPRAIAASNSDAPAGRPSTPGPATNTPTGTEALSVYHRARERRPRPATACRHARSADARPAHLRHRSVQLPLHLLHAARGLRP